MLRHSVCSQAAGPSAGKTKSMDEVLLESPNFDKLVDQSCGATAATDESICWRVWAPRVPKVELLLSDGQSTEFRSLPMQQESGGFFVHRVADGADGPRNAFSLVGG